VGGLIQTPEYANRLNKRFGLRERLSAPTLGDEITPVVLVEDLVSVPDYSATGKKNAGCAIASAPGLGSADGHYLINPPGSGVVAILQALWLSSSALFAAPPAEIGILLENPAGVVLGGSVFTNARIAGRPKVVPGTIIGVPPSVATVRTAFVHLSGGFEFLDLSGYVLAPGQALAVNINGDAGGAQAATTFRWFEVDLIP